MADILTIKRGSTFRLRVSLMSDLRGAEFQAQVRAMGSQRLVADLEVRVIDVDNAVVLELESPTDTWPITNLSADVEARLGSGEVVHTETLQIKVVRNVTD